MVNEFVAVALAVAGFSLMVYALAVVFPPLAMFVGGFLLVAAAGRVMQDAVE